MRQGLRLQNRPAMSGPFRTACYWTSGSSLALATALILEGAFHLNLLFGWLIGINLFAFLYFGIDKLNAEWADDKPERKAMKARIPEPSLLLLALVGGSLGGILSILLFHHKVDEDWFVFRLLLILAAHLVILYFVWDKMRV